MLVLPISIVSNIQIIPFTYIIQLFLKKSIILLTNITYIGIILVAKWGDMPLLVPCSAKMGRTNSPKGGASK